MLRIPPNRYHNGPATELGGNTRGDKPQIGDVNESIVERGEDAGNAEHELACSMRKYVMVAHLD